jgi:transcription elongation factor
VIKDVHGPDALKQRGDSYIFDNKTFRNGMLILKVQALHILVPIPFPSLREIMPFVNAGFIAYETALDVTLHEELARIRPGDHVRLIAGEQAGCRAMVITIEDYIACVDILPVDMDPDQPSHLVNVPIYSMQRILRIGDNVRVRDDAEELAGSSGFIVAISEDEQAVEFIEEKTRKPVNFFFTQTTQQN